jgi:hypothetical protein
VDTAYLNRKWQDLSEYCHMQFRPEETFESQSRKFQKQGFALILEILQKFREWKVESNCSPFAHFFRSFEDFTTICIIDRYIIDQKMP